MVERNRPPQDVDTKELRDGALRTSDSALTVASEDGKVLDDLRPLYSRDSGVSGLGSAESNEVDKFNTLCDGVLTAHSMFDMYLTEILTMKDELLKYSLPSNLLINLTLACSKLYRSASDLSVPTTELVRLVRLYSAQWEAKSNVLKKLHEDYESKQRRLDLALKKLELVGVASEKIEKEKRIMNWEKIFSKVMCGKSHGHRWKFLINSLKEKVQSGEIHSLPFPSNSTDEDQNDSKNEPVIPRHHRRNVRSLRHQTLLRREARNSRTGSSQQEDNEAESELSSDDNRLNTHVSESMRRISRDRQMRPANFTSARFKSKYPFEREGEFPRRLRTERTESPTGVRSVNTQRASTPGRRFAPKNVSFFDESSEDKKPPASTKEDKSVWTGQPQYDRYLHVRVYKPNCKRAPDAVCTICFGDQVFSGGRYESNEDTKDSSSHGHDTDGKSREPGSNEFQEFVFPVSEDKVYVKGQAARGIESQQLRIAVQPEPGRQMVAMCTVEYSDLKILKTSCENEDVVGFCSPEIYPLLSLVSDQETMFNSVVGHVPLVCYRSRKERPQSFHQSTQTSSIHELFDEMMAARRIEEEEKNKFREDDPAKIYTEDEFREMEQKHIEELNCLRSEYELQLAEMARSFGRSSPDGKSPYDIETKFVSVRSKSPLPASPKLTVPQRPRTADPKSTPRRTKKIRTSQILPEWGKNLPVNFFDRLEQFSIASAKHRQELSEKTKKEVQENYELQMATQNRLNMPDNEIDLNDVCLPALFMPSRMGTVYSPKASLYFHPSGVSRSRFAQPPSVFKLPCVAGDRSSVMNLYNLSQTFLASGPTWLSKNERPRSACSAVSQQSHFHISPSHTECDPHAKLKSE